MDHNEDLVTGPWGGLVLTATLANQPKTKHNQWSLVKEQNSHLWKILNGRHQEDLLSQSSKTPMNSQRLEQLAQGCTRSSEFNLVAFTFSIFIGCLTQVCLSDWVPGYRHHAAGRRKLGTGVLVYNTLQGICAQGRRGKAEPRPSSSQPRWGLVLRMPERLVERERGWFESCRCHSFLG